MSQYTTGEIAKLCGVTVRTVQYYDTRGILIPSALSEGGRRLYSEYDLKRMRIICFLRELDIPINAIGELLKDEDPASVISIVLQQQTTSLRQELKEKQETLQKMESLQKKMRSLKHFSVESIGDIAYIMEDKKKINRIRMCILCAGIIAEIIETGTFLLGIIKGIWLPYLIGIPFIIAIAAWMMWFYYTKVKFLCPQCHTVFRPKFRQMFWASHTISTRKLTCSHCGRNSFCVEVYGGDSQ